MLVAPTAQMFLGDSAVTEKNTEFGSPGEGAGTKLHLVPSQCSVSGSCRLSSSGYSPTAQASSSEGAATSYRTVEGGFTGDGTNHHSDPSQCSMRAWTPKSPSLREPTAQASRAEVADTAKSCASAGAPGEGTKLHLVPFQCSMTGLKMGPACRIPTAHTSS